MDAQGGGGVITGHYVLELTCDNASCNWWQYRSTGTFKACDEANAKFDAELEGWHLGDEDLCPQCAREKDGS